MNRLIIEGREADLIQKPININFQINYIGDLSTRNSTFSNTIDLPRTSNNEAIFEMIGVMGSASRAPYKNLRCTYIQDNITLINNGYIQLKEMTDTTFKCNILDGLIDLAERLKGKTLEDLTFSDVNHTLNMTTFSASQSNTEGYIYATADYGKGTNGGIIKIEGQAPALFLHSLFSKILIENGFFFEGSIFQNPSFLEEVITVNKGYDILDVELTPTNVGNGSTNEVSNSYTGAGARFITSDHNIQSYTSASGDLTRFSNVLVSTSDQRFKIDLNIYSNNFNGQSFFKTLVNGGVANTVEMIQDGYQTYTKTIYLEVNAGDQISFQTQSVIQNDEPNTFNPPCTAQASFTIIKETGGQFIDLKKLVGNKIKQIDLLKDVMQRYGLMMKVDDVDKRLLKFITFEELLSDRSGAIDLSKNFNALKNTDFTTIYAKENTAEYKYGSDISEPTKDGVLKIDNDVVKPTDSLFKSPYEISPVALNSAFFFVPIWEPQDSDFKTKEITNRIFKTKPTTGTKAFNFFGSSSNTITNAKALTLDNVGMQYYLDTYYPSLRNLMNTYKELTVSMNLSIIDMLRMDFFKLVYLKQFQAYFYLQRYTNNGEVKLLQITNFQ